jgi:hypothetical protein
MNHTEQKIKELEELANEFNNKLKDLREEANREEFKVGDYFTITDRAKTIIKETEWFDKVFKLKRYDDEENAAIKLV